MNLLDTRPPFAGINGEIPPEFKTLSTPVSYTHLAICEGAMGYYDGIGGTSDIASAWHLADTLNLPVLLVLRPKGASLTLAAQVRGLMSFRTPHHIAGIILNDCKENLYRILAPMLEKETGVPVIGYLDVYKRQALMSPQQGVTRIPVVSESSPKKIKSRFSTRCIL